MEEVQHAWKCRATRHAPSPMILRGIHPGAIIDAAGRLDLPRTTIVEPGSVIFIGPDAEISFGEMNTLYAGCVFRLARGYIRTGNRVSFGPGCLIYETRAGLTIGDDCLIAGGVKLCGVQHGFQGRGPMRDQPTRELPITIGDDVWLGMGVIVMPGVSIGSHTVVGAGSVVTKDLPSDVIAHGTPARVVSARAGATRPKRGRRRADG